MSEPLHNSGSIDIKRIYELTVVMLTGGLLAWMAAEGLLQLAGWKMSGHALFSVTGPFDNPGPYGGFLAILLCICSSFSIIHWREAGYKIAARICAAISVLGAVALAATWSRTAWVGVLIAAIVLLLRERANLSVMTKLTGRQVLLSVLVVLALAAGAFLMKKESALGRVHIWRMELRVIGEHPLKGVGREYYLGEYGKTQAKFFASMERPSAVKRVAGCPEYAFNEYLKFGMMYGVGGLILSLVVAAGIIGILLGRRSPLAYGAVAFAVFAAGSYPLSLWQFRALLWFFGVAAAVSLAVRKQSTGPHSIWSLRAFIRWCC